MLGGRWNEVKLNIGFFLTFECPPWGTERGVDFSL